MSLALWSLAVAGSALVLTQSGITEPFREWLIRTASQVKTTRELYHAYQKSRLDDPTIPEIRSRLLLRASFYPLAMTAKLVSCPMCSGFWLGAGWAALFGERTFATLIAHGFGGSLIAAYAVAPWLALGEAHAALGLWRYNHPPKDRP